MSGLARTRVRRGIRITRSSGPHPTVGGNLPRDSAVMSEPIMAKSPPSNSKMSGQPWSAYVLLPFACGSGPRRRRNCGVVFIFPFLCRDHQLSTKKSKNKIQCICGGCFGLFSFPFQGGKDPEIPKSPWRKHPNAPEKFKMEPGKVG